LLTEAGGHVARWDGRPYRFHESGSGILATISPRLWDEAAAALLDSLEVGAGDLMPADVKIPRLRD
jgi:hypothetical protein